MKKQILKLFFVTLTILSVAGCGDIEESQPKQQTEQILEKEKPEFVRSPIRDVEDYISEIERRERRGYFFSAQEKRVLEERGFQVTERFILSDYNAYEKPVFSYVSDNKTFIWYLQDGSIFRRAIKELEDVDFWNTPEYQGEFNQ